MGIFEQIFGLVVFIILFVSLLTFLEFSMGFISYLVTHSLCLDLYYNLKSKGYDWLSLEDAKVLYFSIGNAVKHLPPHDEIVMIPGIQNQDINALIYLSHLLPYRFKKI